MTLRRLVERYAVSTRAPVKGATLLAEVMIVIIGRFNSRSREGSDSISNA